MIIKAPTEDILPMFEVGVAAGLWCSSDAFREEASTKGSVGMALRKSRPQAHSILPKRERY